MKLPISILKATVLLNNYLPEYEIKELIGSPIITEEEGHAEAPHFLQLNANAAKIQQETPCKFEIFL